MRHTQDIWVIAGPTASGKSARALALAKAHNGVIINADATQLYEELQVLSARPDAADLAEAPHRLYGVAKGPDAVSVADWLAMAADAINAAWRNGAQPIICGGTGLYLKALMQGLSPIPEIDPAVRAQLQAEITSAGNEALHAELEKADAKAAAAIPAANTQRVIRALEVWRGTGKPISAWQAEGNKKPLPDSRFTIETITLPREDLYARCDARFLAMLENGAIEEVKALNAMGYDASLPLMKAVGVAELTAYLEGSLTQDEATALAQRNTRRYAKRQLTWLRHQL